MFRILANVEDTGACVLVIFDVNCKSVGIVNDVSGDVDVNEVVVVMFGVVTGARWDNDGIASAEICDDGNES